MKKESSESQQRVLRKLLRNSKPQLPVMNIPGIRKATLPFPVGKRTTRSETLRVKNDRVTKVDNEDSHSVESADSQPEQQKNVCHSKSSSHETMETEDKNKKPRKKRISRALFRHDNINYIKPKKQQLLQKSFTLDFKKLVDKSKEIIIKIDDSEGDDKGKEKNCETTDMDKVYSPSNSESSSEKVSQTQNLDHLLLDMPSLDSPCSTENVQQSTETKKSPTNVPKINTTEAQIQTNNSQNLLYRFYGLIPNKPRSTEQIHNEQTRNYKMAVVPDVPKSNENDKRIIPPNTSKELHIRHYLPPQTICKQNIPNKTQVMYPSYLQAGNYGYFGYPCIPQQYPQIYQQTTKNLTSPQIDQIKNGNKANCTIVKEIAAQELKNKNTKYNIQNYMPQIPLVQNIQHRHRTDNTNQAQKRVPELPEIHQNKRVRFNLDTNTLSNNNSNNNKQPSPIINDTRTPIIINQSEKEKSVIVSPNPKESSSLNKPPITQCSVIRKISSSKNLHTIENILARPEKEVNNNQRVNITNKNVSQNETKSAQHETKSAQNETKNAQNETKSAQNETKSAQNETKSAQNETKSAQQSVIIAPKTDANSLKNKADTRKMPELIEIPEDFKPKNTNSQTKYIHYDLVTKVAETCKEQLPLNLSLKTDVERQSIIVNNTSNDPLKGESLTFIKSEEQFNGYLKLLEEKNATGPYLFYKFISNIRKKYNHPMFDLLTFFVLLKQGRLSEYKEMYNQCFK